MNENAKIIITLCSHIDVNDVVKPFEPKEWSALASKLMEHNLEPCALLDLSIGEMNDLFDCDRAQIERVQRLLDRAGALTFALNRLENTGIFVVTRADQNYPRRLKRSLGNSCPPMFYFAGDLELLNSPGVGFAGSRTIGEADEKFTESTVCKVIERNYGIVSGGAKGVDSIAETTALKNGSTVVSFLSDAMLRKIKLPQNLHAIQNGRLLLLSAVNPDAGFHAGTAMMRNRYIYTQAQGTVIIRSDYNKGGTWTGAKEALKHKWSPVFCWNNDSYPGNQALIRHGAFPVDVHWDGNLEAATALWSQDQPEQLSFFS